ncbi:MAG: hypothetical protein WB608_23860 [Terracidiphilus sp.]
MTDEGVMGAKLRVCLLIALCMPALVAGQQSAPVQSKVPESRPKPERKGRHDYVRRDPVETFVATPMRVAHLEEVVAETHGKHDADVARELSGLRLTERLSDARLQLWEKALPGKKARTELAAIAFASVFLAPPAVEIPALDAPDLAAQHHMLAQTVDLLDKSIPKLPNFSVTEKVIHYEDMLEVPESEGAAEPSVQPWRLTRSFKRVVRCNGGNEDQDEGNSKEKQNQKTEGLFGPILSRVVVDASHSKVTWSRWEQTEAGLRGVFRYEVLEADSDYGISKRTHSENGKDVFVQRRTGYHGEIAIDPASGVISRLTIVADFVPDSPIDRIDVMVEYGPVQMGGRTYNFPLRSITISGQHNEFQDQEGLGSVEFAETTLQEVTFGDYQVKGSRSTLSTGSAQATP